MINENSRVGVIGGGSWATALVKMLTNNVTKVNWWMRNKDSVDFLNQYQRNPRYLSSVKFDAERIEVTTHMQKVIDESDLIVMAHPSAFLYDLFKDSPEDMLKGKVIFTSIKGIVPEVHSIPARYFHKKFNIPYDNIGMISGPCHAEEVAMEKLSYLTIACPDEEKAEVVGELLSCRYIKTSTSDDLFGTEMCAVLKNIYAIGAGICHGLGYGDNFQALLISNAIREAERFIDAVNPTHRDVKSSAYLGDLLVTAYSQFSRNRNFGSMVGKGYSVRSAQIEMNMVAEGYYALESIVEINKKYNVEIPIIDAIYRICFEKVAPFIEIEILTDKLS